MSSTADTGFAGSIVKSKKLGLVFAFATSCMGILATSTGLTQTMQIALLSAATLAVVSYVLGQSYLEAHGMTVIEEDPEQCASALSTPAIPTTTTAAK